MNIIITGKHLEITEEIKGKIEALFTGIFADKTLKANTIRVLAEFEKGHSRYIVKVDATVKQHEFTTTVEDHDFRKAVMDAAEKIGRQVNKYYDKLQSHTHEPLRDIIVDEVAVEE